MHANLGIASNPGFLALVSIWPFFRCPQGIRFDSFWSRLPHVTFRPGEKRVKNDDCHCHELPWLTFSIKNAPDFERPQFSLNLEMQKCLPIWLKATYLASTSNKWYVAEQMVQIYIYIYLEPQTTSFKWVFSETTIFWCNDLESSNWNNHFKVVV